jgi:hypothetical protein
MILSKMLVTTNGKLPSQDENGMLEEEDDTIRIKYQFKTQFSLTSINQAIDILNRNQERDVISDEMDEKYTLSLSICNFLKLASHDKETSVHMRKQSRELK